jgi:S-adenosylmethionine/arginine decarboxylase-like enzyme
LAEHCKWDCNCGALDTAEAFAAITSSFSSANVNARVRERAMQILRESNHCRKSIGSKKH